MKYEAVVTDDLTTTLVGENLLLRLLGKVLYNEPDAKWLEELVFEKIFSEIPFGAEQPEIIRGFEILQQWSTAQTNGILETEFAELKLDYTRLFRAPFEFHRLHAGFFEQLAGEFDDAMHA